MNNNAGTPQVPSRQQTDAKKKKTCLTLFACGGLMFLLSFITIFAVLFAVFISNAFPSEAEAIEKVLKKDAQAQQNLPDNNRQAIQTIVKRMRAIDTSDCPGDFRAAYERHIHAWEGMRDQILSEPDGALESFFVGFLNGLAGDWTGGAADMEAAENYWSMQIRDTWNEVRAIALQHGANTP